MISQHPSMPANQEELARFIEKHVLNQDFDGIHRQDRTWVNQMKVHFLKLKTKNIAIPCSNQDFERLQELVDRNTKRRHHARKAHVFVRQYKKNPIREGSQAGA